MDGWIVRLEEAVPRTQSQDVPQMLQGHLLPPSAMVPSLCHPTFLGYSFTCVTATWFADQAKILELTQNLHAD